MIAAQLRAARGLIGISQAELATLSGVSHPTIKRIEIGGDARMSTIQALRSALENAGVDFIAENGGGPGVRLKSGARQSETDAAEPASDHEGDE